MKTLRLGVVAALALSAAACANGAGYHDSFKLQAGGLNMNGSTGVSAGYLGATVDRVMNVDKDGKPITVPGGCKTDAVDTFTNLNSKASAQASSVAPVASAAVGSVINSPTIAWASGDVTANGGAAIIASAAGTATPADTIAAYCGNAAIPSAPAGDIVRAGVAPK
jgi:hypothetical protein